MTGATSLSLVRDELFATIEQTEMLLEQFIAERSNGNLLQQAVENFQQIRGTLNMIGLAGAEHLAQEVFQQATDIPSDIGVEWDGKLAALNSALHVLRRYLESVDFHRLEMPELLLPAINELRQANALPLLPESHFFSVRLDPERPAPAELKPAKPLQEAELKRLRQMYQVGLLGLIRDDNPQAGVKLMSRAISRLDGLFATEPRGRLCWIAAAALESQVDGQLLPRKGRKMLFSRVDRELKQMLGNPQYEAPRSLLKELIYLVALADTRGPHSMQVREVFGLNPLPFTDHMLEDAYQRLAGPGQGVLRSLSTAIHDELAIIKDGLDLIERGTAPENALGNLHAVLGKLSKTLDMVGLSTAGNALYAQLPVVSGWIEGAPLAPEELLKLADVVLFVESMVASLESSQNRQGQQSVLPPVNVEESFAAHQYLEARIVVIDEAQGGLAMAKRAITAYLESAGDKMNLANVPVSLQSVRGGLLFIEQERAAALVAACAQYIQQQMLEMPHMPSEPMLETLADALTSLEYYLEGGALLRNEVRTNVLDLATESVRALGVPVAA